MSMNRFGKFTVLNSKIRMRHLEITVQGILRKIKGVVKAEPFKSPAEVYEEIFPEELDKLDANTRSLIVHMFPIKTSLNRSLYRFNLSPLY